MSTNINVHVGDIDTVRVKVSQWAVQIYIDDVEVDIFPTTYEPNVEGRWDVLARLFASASVGCMEQATEARLKSTVEA
jgi:hypothetical protein